MWLQLTPQIAWNNAVVRHAVIALGVGSEAHSSAKAPNHEDADFAGNQYAKALWLLREQIALDRNSISQVTVLLACLLFVAFELQRHAHEEAREHLLAGLRLVREASACVDPGSTTSTVWSSEADLLDQLRVEFERLDLQFSFYNSTRIKATVQSTPLDRDLDVDLDFGTLLEAERSFNACLRLMRELMYDMGNTDYGAKDRSSNTSDSLWIRKTHIVVLLAKWENALKRMLLSLKSDKDIAAAALLQTQQISAVLMMSEDYLNGNYCDWSRHTSCFRALVEQAGVFVAYNSKSYGTDTMLANFSLEMGIIAPLYFTMLRCQDGGIKREALRLLKLRAHREGIWDGPFIAAACESILELDMTTGPGYYQQLYKDFFDVHSDRGTITYRANVFEQDGQGAVFQINVADDRAKQRDIMAQIHSHALTLRHQGLYPRKPLAD